MDRLAPKEAIPPPPLVLSASISPMGPLPTPGVATVTLNLSNVGAYAGGDAYAISAPYPFDGPGSLFKLGPISETSPCVVSNLFELDPVPGGTIYPSAIVIFGTPIDAGATAHCVVGLT